MTAGTALSSNPSREDFASLLEESFLSHEITEEVRTELRNRLELSDADIDRGGFKIVTTIDKDAQAAAVKAVKEHRPTGRRTRLRRPS